MQAWSDRLQRAWAGHGLLACTLLPLAALYAGIVGLRRMAYRMGWLEAVRLPVPVVVVGNIVAGGAGKTPTVLALTAALQRHGYSPGIVSRGYGGSARGVRAVEPYGDTRACGDEPILLRRRSGVPLFIGRDRVAAGQALMQSHPSVDVIVSDDGRQHLALARDVEIVVFDERGVGNGWMLPAGPLRELLPARLPANAVVLYNAAAPTTPLPGHVSRRRLRGVAPLQQWWHDPNTTTTPLADLRGRAVLAAAGIAHPERFFSMLRSAGLAVVPLALDDHHDYATLPWPHDVTDVVVTEKDAVKLSPERVGRTRVWVATLDFDLPPALEVEVMRLLSAGRKTPARPSLHGNSTA